MDSKNKINQVKKYSIPVLLIAIFVALVFNLNQSAEIDTVQDLETNTSSSVENLSEEVVSPEEIINVSVNISANSTNNTSNFTEELEQ